MIEQLDFTRELEQAIEPLRESFRRMLWEWGAPRTASALHRLSGAGQTICWQVFRIVNADDAVAESRHAPTVAALKRLLAAAENAGVSMATIRDIQKAAHDFQNFIRDHATDRAAFDSMLAGASNIESGEKILLHHRRAAYRAMSHLWGIQTDLQMISAMVRRSADGKGIDESSIIMQQGVRRLRPGTQVTLFGYNKHTFCVPTSDCKGAAKFEPFDRATAQEYDGPIWAEYCSQPLPRMETVELPSGWVLRNLVGDEIGLKASINCTLGYSQYNVSLTTDTDGRDLYYLSFSNIRKPVALLTMDLLIHRPSLPGVVPEMMIYQHQEGNLAQDGARKAQQFPLDEHITRVGRGDKVRHDQVPQYSKMLQKSAQFTGWDLAEFDTFRVQIPYPIMGTAIRLYFYL